MVDFIRWSEQESYVLQGMVYDDGMGMKAVWLQSDSGQRCKGDLIYTGHFRIECAEVAAGGRWQLVAEDKAGNRTQRDVP